MNRKKFTSLAFLFASVVLIIGLSACDRVSQIVQPTTPQMEETSEEIAIGVVLPVTGRYQSSFGTSIPQGFELALQEINTKYAGHLKLKLVVEDDQSTVEGAVAAFTNLSQRDDIPVILGPSLSSQTREAFPIAQENQVVAISPSSSAIGLSAIGDFVFRVSLTSGVLVPSGIEVTHAKLGYQTAATIYDAADLFSTDADEAVREALAAKGIEVLTTETFQGGDTDFSEQLTRIKALNPDIIFLSSLPPEKPGMLIQAKEVGIAAPFILRTLTIGDVEAAGEAAEGAMTFIGWSDIIDTPANQAFLENYRATYNSEPNNYVARSYATVHILAEAITRAQSTDSTAIRDALANIRDLDTVFGKFSFDANGDAVYDPKVLIVEGGTLKLFE